MMTEREQAAFAALLKLAEEKADALEQEEAAYKKRKMKSLAAQREREWKRLQCNMGIARSYLREKRK